MNYLKDLTNEQLKACLLGDMESLRDGGWVQHVEGHCPDDDTIDATVSVIEEVFRRIDVYSNKRKPHDRQPFASAVVNVLREANIEVEDVSTDNGSVFLTLSEPEVSEDRHALSNKLITNALKRGDIK